MRLPLHRMPAALLAANLPRRECAPERDGMAPTCAITGAECIADFCAPRHKLVVEVDGGYRVQCARADARRDRRLGHLGYRVLRVPALLVQHHIEEAVALVRAALAE